MKTDGSRPNHHTQSPKIPNKPSGKNAQFKHKKLSQHETERKTPHSAEPQGSTRLSERSVTQDIAEDSVSIRADMDHHPDWDSASDSDYVSDFESDTDSDDDVELAQSKAPLPHLIRHADDYINPDIDPADKYPLMFWGEQLIHQLQKKATQENRPVTMDDYWQLYDTGNINLLSTNARV